MGQFIRGDQRERLIAMPVHLDCDRPLKTRLFSTEGFAQTPVELRIAGLPKAITCMHPLERNIAVAECEHGLSSASFHRVNASAFFLLIRVPGIEYNTIARFERRLKIDEALSILDPLHLSQIDPALLAEARVRQLLVVNAAEPAGVKAARKRHFQIVTRSAVDFRNRPF